MRLPFSRSASAGDTAPGVHTQPFWSYRPRSDREAGDAVVSNFLLHWFPSKIYKPSLSWSYSAWLGTISGALFFLLMLSGLPLMFLYIPSVERAYQSVKDIEYVVTFGWWIRAVHRIAAHLMVVAVVLHLARVFFTGRVQERRRAGAAARVELGHRRRDAAPARCSCRSPATCCRGTSWPSGPSRSAPTSPRRCRAIGPRIRELLIGGRAIEQATLIRFYVLHIIVLPGALGGALRVPHVADPQGRRAGQGRCRDAGGRAA